MYRVRLPRYLSRMMHNGRNGLRNVLPKQFGQRNRKQSFIGCFIFITFFFFVHTSFSSVWHVYDGGYVHEYDEIHHIRNPVPKILLWTPFFFEEWISHVQESIDNCNCSCTVTDNRDDIKTADIVIFHTLDMWFWQSLPSYRSPQQVWALYVAEPPPHIHYTGMTFKFPRNLFNWTFSYRKDSTVFTPYGRIVLRNSDDEVEEPKNYAEGKSNMVASITSNCYDDAKRYRVLHELSKYTQVDSYGRCGNLLCSREAGVCDKILQPYRFIAAFENSNCKSYVTEKYWNALNSGSIPLVNWKDDQRLDIVAPKSYINVHDFGSVEELGKYLNYLSTNETEYNSYFAWRQKYKVMHGYTIWGQFCDFCCALKDSSRKAQTVDYIRWLENDSCQLWSVSSKRPKETISSCYLVLLFNVPLKNISLIWRRQRVPVKSDKF